MMLMTMYSEGWSLNYRAIMGPGMENRKAAGREGRRKPPQAMLDDIAECKLDGGFDTRPSNICDKCWLTRSENGKCGCI